MQTKSGYFANMQLGVAPVSLLLDQFILSSSVICYISCLVAILSQVL